MIRVRDHVDEIVEKCFSDDAKRILEFEVKGLSISVKDQFLFHYENACYIGDKDSLIRAVAYKVHMASDKLLKIENYQQNLVRLFDLGEYSRVRRGFKTEIDTNSTIGALGSETKSTFNRTDNYQSTDKNRDLNVSDNRTGTSQTNQVHELQYAIPQAEITDDGKLRDPQMTEDEDKMGFQHYSKDLSTSDSLNTNTLNSQRRNTDTSTNSLRNASTTVRGGKSDSSTDEVMFVTSDARFKMWSKQLPLLKTRF